MSPAGPGGVGIAVRSVALPVVIGAHWWSRLQRRVQEDVPPAAASARLFPKVVADEIFLATEILSAALIGVRERHRVADELERASKLYARKGWLEDPSGYHETPPPLERYRLSSGRAWGLDFQHLEFESGWQPARGEPGRLRWLGYGPNRIAHARLITHKGEQRPWVVCTPGFRMGQATVDFAGFNARWLHQEMGLNVAIPVLPFHGPRKVGRRTGDGFLTGDVLDTVHAQAQAVWDVRRLLGWLRASGAPSIGLYGVSLGGYTAALVAALEAELACVIAGVPASDWLSLLGAHAPPAVLRASERLGFPWEKLERILRIVSPLAIEPRVPADRRFLFAGTADRLAPPEQARSLWHHWGCPRLTWYHGSHVSFLIEGEVKALLREALETSGLVDPRALA